MAPREGNVPTKSPTPASPAPEGYCGFWMKIGGLKFISSTKKIYEDTKKCGTVGTGLLALEKGVGVASVPLRFAATKWATAYPQTAVALNSIACECLDMLEQKVPVLQKPATELVCDVKEKTNNTMRKAFRTFPGRQLLCGIDKAIDVSQKFLDLIVPEKEKGVKKPEKGLETRSTFSIRKMAAWPIDKCIRTLRLIKRFIMSHLGLRRSLRHGSTTVGSKVNKKQIHCRRKMTPVKRLKTIGFLGRVLSKFLEFVGIDLGRTKKDGDIRLYLIPNHVGQTPVNVESAPEKRKHEELSESESDSSVLDLDNLEGYISEDDPDYEPPNEEAWSTDSFEFAEGETESELEEDTGTKQPTEGPPAQVTAGTTPVTTGTTPVTTTSTTPSTKPATSTAVSQQEKGASPKPPQKLVPTDTSKAEAKSESDKKNSPLQTTVLSPKKSQAGTKAAETKGKLDAKPVSKWGSEVLKWGPEGNDASRKAKDSGKS